MQYSTRAHDGHIRLRNLTCVVAIAMMIIFFASPVLSTQPATHSAIDASLTHIGRALRQWSPPPQSVQCLVPNKAQGASIIATLGKAGVKFAVGKVPLVGGVLGVIVNNLWPDPKPSDPGLNPACVWTSIKVFVEAYVQDYVKSAINENNAILMQSEVNALKFPIRDYQKQAYNTLAKAERFISLDALVQQCWQYVFDMSDPWQGVWQQQLTYGHILMAVRQEQLLHFQEILGPINATDDSAEKMTDAVNMLVEAFGNLRATITDQFKDVWVNTKDVKGEFHYSQWCNGCPSDTAANYFTVSMGKNFTVGDNRDQKIMLPYLPAGWMNPHGPPSELYWREGCPYGREERNRMVDIMPNCDFWSGYLRVQDKPLTDDMIQGRMYGDLNTTIGVAQANRDTLLSSYYRLMGAKLDILFQAVESWKVLDPSANLQLINKTFVVPLVAAGAYLPYQALPQGPWGYRCNDYSCSECCQTQVFQAFDTRTVARCQDRNASAIQTLSLWFDAGEVTGLQITTRGGSNPPLIGEAKGYKMVMTMAMNESINRVWGVVGVQAMSHLGFSTTLNKSISVGSQNPSRDYMRMFDFDFSDVADFKNVSLCAFNGTVASYPSRKTILNVNFSFRWDGWQAVSNTANAPPITRQG